MWKLIPLLLCAIYSAGAQVPSPSPQFPLHQFHPLPERSGSYRLCTYKNDDYMKCIHTVHVAENNSIPLQLECVQKDRRENCLQSIRDGSTDMVVLTGHGYKEARQRGLMPVIYALEDESRLYIAVAPRDLSVVDLQEAPLSLNQSDHGAFHAALFFNLQRAHDICGFTQVSLRPTIRIVNSADYVPNAEEILICPNRFYADFMAYKDCNVQAGLQRAVFVGSRGQRNLASIRRIFDTILARFGPNSPPSVVENGKNFDFFDTFNGRENVLFRKNTIAFDLSPTYRNGVTEDVFNYLHCNNEDQSHNPLSLL